MQRIYTKIIISILLIISLLCTGCSKDNQPVTESRFLLDTYISITVYNKNDAKYLDEAFNICSEYEDILSKTSQNGDIIKIQNNRYADVSVSESTYEVIEIYKQLYEISNKKLDCTIGTVSNLWDYNESTLPDSNLISEAVSHIDQNKLVLNDNSVRLESDSIMLDFGAVAKGYISEKVKDFLVSKGVKSAVLNFGGNVITIGAKPDGAAFKIGIQKPFGDQNDVIEAVKIKDKAVITAGVYERFIEADGNIYHHILDPATGYGTNSDLYSATIICEDAALGDAYSTICILLGKTEALELINKTENMEAIFVTDENELIYSDNVKKYICEE